MSPSHNKRIFKNAAFLFLRMVFNTAITLYTSRVLLTSLGVDDFGIYYVVAGFIFMLGFLHGSMTSATQRFISFELGKTESKNAVNNIFRMAFNIHIAMGIIILILAETIGLWFLKNKLNIPIERKEAAEFVFHFSLITFFINIISVPFSATVIAYEDMGTYAKISILDTLLKLAAAISLPFLPYDNLQVFSFFILISTIIITAIYYVFTKTRYHTTTISFYWDKILFSKMLGFIGWNVWGNAALVLSNHGINILLNIFFGPTVNTARTISYQVSNALNSFIQSLQMAFNPQLIKSYSAKNYDNMMELLFKNSKCNFVLMLILFCPLIMSIDTILKIWLDQVPLYTNTFTKIVLVTVLIDSLSGPIITSALATGKIKLYQIVVGGVLLLNVPLSYLVLKLGYSPQAVFYIGTGISAVALCLRVLMLSRLLVFPTLNYIKKVILPCIMTLISVVPFLFVLRDNMSQSLLVSLIVFPLVSLFITLTMAYIFALDQDEKQLIHNIFMKVQSKITRSFERAKE